MFTPDAPQMGESPATYSVTVTLFAMGCVLTFKSFGPN